MFLSHFKTKKKWKVFTYINKRFGTLFRLWSGQRKANPRSATYTRAVVHYGSSREVKFDSSSWSVLKPVYFAFVKTMLEFFLQTTHFVKSRAHSPRPTSKIIAILSFEARHFDEGRPCVEPACTPLVQRSRMFMQKRPLFPAKFLECIDYQIFLPTVLRCAR